MQNRLIDTLTRQRVRVLDRLRAGERTFEILADTGAALDERLAFALLVDKHRSNGTPPMLAFDFALMDAQSASKASRSASTDATRSRTSRSR